MSWRKKRSPKRRRLKGAVVVFIYSFSVPDSQICNVVFKVITIDSNVSSALAGVQIGGHSYCGQQNPPPVGALVHLLQQLSMKIQLLW